MATIKGDITFLRWEIEDFASKRNSTRKTVLYSKNFPLAKHPSVQFALFVDTKYELWDQRGVGLMVKKNESNLGTIRIDTYLWLENKYGQVFGEFSNPLQNNGYHSWLTGNRNTVYRGIGKPDDDFNVILSSMCANRESLFVCCKVIDRNPDPEPIPKPKSIAPIINFEHDVLQAQWSLFEQGKYDAILKVGDTEFKILKIFLTCHSDVFEQAFSSNFKEGKTNVIEIKDFDEKTIKNLVKWLYTGQIEDNDVIDQLFEAADKYNINLLKKFCFQHMIASLNKDNAFSRLVLASMHNDDQLKEACLDQISLMDKSDWATFAISQEWIGFVRKNVTVSDEITELVRDKLKIQ